MKKIDKNYKIIVTPKQSKRIQEICFFQKIGWGYKNEFEIQYIDKPQLFIYKHNEKSGIYYGGCNIDDDYLFEKHDNIQIDAEEFIKMYSEEFEEKINNKSPYIFKIIKDSSDTEFVKSLNKIYEEYTESDIEVDYKPLFNTGSITNIALVKIKAKENLKIG